MLWVGRAVAEGAFDMKGAFNDLVVSLASGADPQAIIAELDRLLASVGAIAHRDQTSNRLLNDQLTEQRVMSVTIPIICFGVATFLLIVALGRQVAAQREQIAALKALGFSNAPLALHYLKLVTVIVFIGAALGVASILFGHAMIASHCTFFSLPDLSFQLTPWSVMASMLSTSTTTSRSRGSPMRSTVLTPKEAAAKLMAVNVMARTREWISAAARTDRPVQQAISEMPGLPLPVAAHSQLPA